MSFIEDPTRIYRAVRFEQRYGFKIEEQTFDLMKHSINSEVIEQVSAERLTDELMLVLKEKNTSKVLLRLNEIGLFNSVYPNLNIDIDLFSKIGMAKDKKIDFQLLCLLILFSQTDIESAQNVLEKIRLNKYYKVTISTFISTKNSILNRLKSKKTSNFDLYSMLQNISDEMLEALKILSPDMIIKNNIEHYQQNLRNKKLLIDGNSLKELGIKPGPRFKEIFEKVFEDKLNGKALTYDDEINIVKRIIK